MLITLHRYEDAAGVLSQVIANDPSCASAFCLLSQCRLGMGDASGALDFASSAAAAEPELEWEHRLRSSSLLKLKRKSEALDAAKEAVRLRPDHVLGYTALVTAEIANGHLDKAAIAAERAREIAPQDADTHDAMGRVALRRRRYSEAEECFRTALSHNPQDAYAMNNLGVALLRQHRKEQAIHYFAEASRIDPRFSLPRQNAVSAAKVGTGLAFLGAIGAAGRAISQSIDLVSLVVIAAVVGGGLLTAYLRSRSRPMHEDPKASPELIKQLRRETRSGRLGVISPFRLFGHLRTRRRHH